MNNPIGSALAYLLNESFVEFTEVALAIKTEELLGLRRAIDESRGKVVLFNPQAKRYFQLHKIGEAIVSQEYAARQREVTVTTLSEEQAKTAFLHLTEAERRDLIYGMRREPT